ncbi:hypothetical protein F5890DRAFT_1557948 [Lentinula detonsa]|uniref:Uncharacterized protein n=1 Tax=Lentinula detonsa TaxID=2804962 RepID=A0AA38UQF1_9AGAR|nr:hypothetical protein F5890DRAFT_1557948 [Lentinula detonsa]
MFGLKKQKSGLRLSSETSETHPDIQTPGHTTIPAELDDDLVVDNAWIPEDRLHFAGFFGYREEDEDSEDEGEELEQDTDTDFGDEELLGILYSYTASVEEHEQKARSSTYATGPDISKKAPRTQREYRKARKGQKLLDSFGFSGGNYTVRVGSASNERHSPQAPPRNRARDPMCMPSVPIREETTEPKLLWDDAPFLGLACHAEHIENQAESWEDELDERARLPEKVEVRGWEDLREEVKKELKKSNKKSLPLSKINQLLIIRNFCTLSLKGFSQIDASRQIALQWHEKEGVHFARRVRQLIRHYQVFEQLPTENQGGMCTSRTLLSDENVRNAARAWLVAQKVGNVNPKQFQSALNETILPSLGIQHASPLCVRTACHWLVVLGWRLTVLRKGIYMDGHERVDVVKYWEEVFLPTMAKYECRMARYEGPDQKRVPPVLLPGEKEIIAQFHDESSLHALKYKSKVL